MTCLSRILAAIGIIFVLSTLRCAADQPANDNLANRLILAPSDLWDPNSRFDINGSTEGATFEQGEPPVQLLSDGSGSVWYEWIPGIEGWVDIQLAAGADARVELFHGSGMADLEMFASSHADQIENGSLVGRINTYARTGESVFIRVTSEKACGFGLSVAMEGLGSSPIFAISTSARASVGEPFSLYIATSGDYRPQLYGASALPPGLSLDAATGVISGIPTACGVTHLNLKAKNVTGTSGMTFRIYVDPEDPRIQGTLQADGQVGQFMEYQILADHIPIQYQADGLPDGLVLDATSGRISGVPEMAGTYHVPVTVLNSGGGGSCELIMEIRESSGGEGASLARITKAEYFVDSDPGPGNGTAIDDPAGQSLTNLIHQLASGEIGGQPDVRGRLAVRVMNAEHQWSVAYQRSFEIVAPDVMPADPVAIEYYFDADPGQGEGRAVSVTAQDGRIFVSAQEGAGGISSLEPGMHRLTCRVLDGKGAWSVAYQRSFEIVAPDVMPADPVAIEYYFDADPGQGSGRVLPAAAQGGRIFVSAQEGAVGISSLEPGIHRFTCRVLDGNGAWSIAYQRPFEVLEPELHDPRIDRLEYRWYSAGNAVGTLQAAVPPSPSTTVSLSPTAAVDGLAKGTTYQLVVTPYNRVGKRGISVTVPVLMNVDPPQGYDTWATSLPEGERGMMEDPGSHGIVNLLRYAFGMDPNSPDRSHLPQVSLSGSTGDSERHLSISYHRFQSASGLRYVVEGSDNLLDWTPASGSQTEQSAGEDTVVTFTEIAALPPGGKRFLRVRVER